MKYKIGILVMTGLLLTASSGFAAVHYQSLNNKNGETTLQVKPAASFPAVKDEDIRRLDYTRQLGEQLLAEGTAAIFYVLHNNSGGVTDTRTKPVLYSDLPVLQAKLSGQKVTLVPEIGDGYTFDKASVYFQPVNLLHPIAAEEVAATAEKLRQQAEQSGKDYAMLPVELSDQMQSLTASYRKGDQKVSVHISRTSGPMTQYVDEQVEFTAEKLSVSGTEMLYTRYAGGNSLAWSAEIPGGQELIHYEINDTSGQFFTKEEMVRLAERLLR
ncbi:hypothetical protein [Paenibacillus silagei]|uniref:DUF4367 domain-containing protein n=1 Tax=Paenibacillus silagei TaxID=1670801 RepID=A0ABS4NNF0_9BACL|nr:hypothetical protein [Paenibacillus silagei]MBP2111573.1 hypothetical protein [Paenibacillus silagei]